jgi:hypothetical protein
LSDEIASATDDQFSAVDRQFVDSPRHHARQVRRADCAQIDPGVGDAVLVVGDLRDKEPVAAEPDW